MDTPTQRTCRTRAGSQAIILMEDETSLYGVYQADQLYPAKWDKNGYFVTQEPGKEHKCALDLVLPKPNHGNNPGP